MRRANNGKLKYLLIAAVLIIAMVGIIRMTVPDREDVKDEHAGQVLINDGFDDIWITPYPNVPVNAMARDEVRLENGLPVYSGTDFDTKIGVDVSEHQWEVDWQLASQTIDFAYIRLGYRGYTEGGLFLDPWYEKNITGAAAAGLDTGVYFFSQATNVGEAIEEAKYVIEHLRGFRVNMPVIFDWERVEQEARTDGMTEEAMTECAVAFCKTIQNAGYDAGIYFNRKLGYHGFDLSRLADCAFWVSVPGDYPDYYYACEFWQCSFTGSVPGISGEADLNMRFIPRI